MKIILKIISISILFLSCKTSTTKIYSLDEDGLTLIDATLWEAIKANDIPKVNQVIKNGANVNCQKKWGKRTPLILASHQLHQEIALILLEHGADPFIKDSRTALHWAAHGNQPKLLNKLYDAGMDINVTDYHGVTPIHDAVSWGSLKTLNWFISHNADLNHPRRLGKYTPLHMAILYTNAEYVKILIDNGANYQKLNSDNQTPLQMAYSFVGNSEGFDQTELKKSITILKQANK